MPSACIDGCVVPWEVVPAIKVHELVKFHTEIPGSPTLYTATFILAMNKPKYESLPADLKAVIDKNSGQVAAEAAGRMWDEQAVIVSEMVKKRGNTITALTEDEATRWQQTTRPVIDNLDRRAEGQEPRRREAPRELPGARREIRQDGVTEAPIPGHPAAPPLPEHSPVAAGRARARDRRRRCSRVAAALLVTTSVTLRWLGFGSINGDFELVQIGVALSVFCFLPLTQARRGNIMVDTFTTWLPLRVQRAIDAFWDFVYAGFMALTAWCLMNGARDALASGLTSMMLGLNLWPVFAATRAAHPARSSLTAVDTALQLLRSRS